MRATGTQFLYRLRASYWFVPSLMARAALLMSFATLGLDLWAGDGWLRDWGIFFATTPQGARSVLAAIATSMITVTGVTFSMTILSVSFASAQFGPRLIGNFLRDRGNQVTLGTFIASFIYCLLILRTVRDAPAGGEGLTEFVPHISVLCGILFAVSSVGVLIYFIHHVPETLDVSTITARVGRELESSVTNMFPMRVGEAAQDVGRKRQPLPDGCFDNARDILTGCSGYLQAVDGDGLLQLATEQDLIIRMRFRPGDFANPREVLLQVWPAGNFDEEVEQSVRSFFAWGSERTPTQNTTFLVDQLVEIVVRALSPGVNDPFTANSCFEWLERSLVSLAGRATPDAERYDEQGALRLIAQPTTFADFCDRVFAQTRQYVAGDRNVALKAFSVLAAVIQIAPTKERRDVLLRHVDALLAACNELLPLPVDRELCATRAASIYQMSEDPEFAKELRNTEHWIGGSA